MAVLIAVDDNQTTGEWRRIRSPRYMIGRTEGDMVIPHDIAMSQRHAEVRLVRKEDGFRWYLHDLKSSNGTFVLFDEVRLNKGDQLLVGSRRFLFDVPFCDPAEGPPVLIEIVRNGTGHRIELSGDEVLLGRDPNRCPAFLADDPLIEPEHARVCRNAATGRWHVQRLNSRNGTWYRVSKVRLCHGCWFLLGEQRFRFLMP
jgi:hypothetical protein